MDDFSISSLKESKNEWASRLITILAPLIIEGYKSILDEAIKLCQENNEMNKYLMTFQNFLSRVPKWNSTIIEEEKNRIINKSGCSYLEDLITCVHIIQLKILTNMRVGIKQKKIIINIPKVDEFIHKTYINVARKIYKNVYLFEINIQPLQMQKNNRELELIVQECILHTIRENIPVESILKAYMDETTEEDVTEEIKEEIIENKRSPEQLSPRAQHAQRPETIGGLAEPESGKLSFNNNDFMMDENNKETILDAPKTIERLEELSKIKEIQKNYESDDSNSDYESEYESEYESDGEKSSKLKISNENVKLDILDIHNIDNVDKTIPDLLIDDIEILE
jgi:hypothetical protein